MDGWRDEHTGTTPHKHHTQHTTQTPHKHTELDAERAEEGERGGVVEDGRVELVEACSGLVVHGLINQDRHVQTRGVAAEEHGPPRGGVSEGRRVHNSQLPCQRGCLLVHAAVLVALNHNHEPARAE